MTSTHDAAATAHGSQPQPKHELAQALADALAKAVAAQTGAAWTSRVPPEPPQVAGNGDTGPAAALHLTGTLEGDLFLSLEPAASAELLAALGSASAPEPAQVWLTLATAAQEILLGAPVAPFEDLQIDGPRLAQPGANTQALAQLELLTPEGNRGASVRVRADASLVKSLAQLAAGAHGQAGSTNDDDDNVDDPDRQIERVIDVPLAVTLRFGQRHLTLREVLALSTGSLVELDRQVEEPVDLVLGDRLIARGEVVIVDGNYGLRVTEVVGGAAQRIRRAHAANQTTETAAKATA